MAVARVATTSGHQRRGLKRSGRIRQFAVRMTHVPVMPRQFMWKSGSGLMMRSRPYSMASRPPRSRYHAPPLSMYTLLSTHPLGRPVVPEV
jgi:hypothetical protein